jgi:hypothetical protein
VKTVEKKKKKKKKKKSTEEKTFNLSESANRTYGAFLYGALLYGSEIRCILRTDGNTTHASS